MVQLLVQAGERRDHRATFDAQAHEITVRIVQRLAVHEQILRGVSGLFSASDEVSREMFSLYVSNLQLDEHYPGIQGVGFSPIVYGKQKEAHVLGVRKKGFPDYALFPAGEREAYAPVDFLEPMDARNQRAFGFDIYSEPTRRAAMNQARDSNQAVMSSEVVLRQGTGQIEKSGFIIFLPIYRRAALVGTVEQRRENIAGWVSVPFFMNCLMGHVVGDYFKNIDIHIYDGETASKERLAYASDPRSNGPHAQTGGFIAAKTARFVNHPWTLTLRSSPSFDAEQGANLVGVIRFAGIAVSVFMALLLGSMAIARKRMIALESSEERLSVTLHSIGDAVIATDTLARVTRMNPVAEKLTGWTIALASGRPISEVLQIIHESTRQPVPIPVWETLAHGVTLGLANHTLLISRDGGERPIADSCAPILGREGGVVGAVLVFRDVSEEHAAQRNLQRSQDRFKTIFMQASFGIAVIDSLSGQICELNQRFADIAGRSRQEMAHIDWMRITHPDDLQADLGHMASLNAGKIHEFQMEKRYLRPDDQAVWIDMTVIRMDSGDPAHPLHFCIIQDLTDRKQNEAAQQALDQRLRDHQFYTRSLIESNFDAIIATDSVGIISDVNRQMETLTGSTRDELIGSPFKDHFVDPQRAEACIRQVLSEKRFTDDDLTLRARDGAETPVSCKSATFYDRDRKLQGVFAALRPGPKR